MIRLFSYPALLPSAAFIFALCSPHALPAQIVPSNCGAPQAAIDHIPAIYGQNAAGCGSIYTPNGIDTYANDPTCAGRTPCQHTDDVGFQCVELAGRYFWIEFFQPTIGGWPNWSYADAYTMCQNPLPKDKNGNPLVVKTTSPVHGDLMVWNNNGCDCTTCPSDPMCAGHVAVINTVNSNGTISVVQEHAVAPTGTYNASSAYCFLHATANTGSACKSASTGGTVSGGTLQSACLSNYNEIETASIDGVPAFYNANVPAGCASGDVACCPGGAYMNLYADAKGLSYGTPPNGPYFQTESGWGYQCEEFAYRYFYGQYGIELPKGVGSAYQMCDIGTASLPIQINDCPTCTPASAARGYTPQHGDLMVFYPKIHDPSTPWYPYYNLASSCGVGGGNGHVAVVDKMNSDGTVNVVEQNWENGGKEPRPANLACARCFIHPTAPPKNASSASCRHEPLALATYLTGPAVAHDANGALAVFTRDVNDGQLYYAEQTIDAKGQITGWTPFQPLGGSLLGDPIVIARGSYTVTAPSSWGGAAYGSWQIPAGQFDVFYIGTDYTIWHVWQYRDSRGNWVWSDPASLGGTIPSSSGPAVGPGGQVATVYDPISKVTTLFYTGSDQSILSIQQKSFNGAWNAPATVAPAGTATSNVTAVNQGTAIYLFYRGADNSVQGLVKASGSQWANVPAPAALAPQTPIPKQDMTLPGAVTSNIAYGIDNYNSGIWLFYRGRDNALWYLKPSYAVPGNGSTCSSQGCPWNGLFEVTATLGGSSTSDITTGTLPGGQIQLFYRGQDNGVWSIWQNPTPYLHTWEGWSKHGKLLGRVGSYGSSGVPLLTNSTFSIIGLGTNTDMRQEIFYLDNNNHISHAWQTTTPTLTTPFPTWGQQTSLGGPP